jgi:hypothetical protein
VARNQRLGDAINIEMDYGFEINGILGMDFLIRAKAIINLAKMRIDFADSL